MDLNTLIKDRNGVCVTDGGKNVTVKDAMMLSIDSGLPGDDQLGPTGKLKLFQLATKLSAVGEEGDVTLTAPEITTILDRCAKVLSILAYGQVVQVLDSAQLD